MRPINQNVLVKADDVEEKTAGGLIITEMNKDRMQHAAATGTLIAMCVDAFEEMKANPEKSKPDTRPQPGEKVFFAKYAGAEIEGADGQPYRLMKDVDITGVAA
jgi:chaperonin GroES